MSSASPGLVETGAPAFALLGVESLGLDSAPTDIQLMPDGRVLVIAGQQLALGDGVRWEVFRQAPTEGVGPNRGVKVDRDGEIYLGVPGRGARVEFGADGLWRLATEDRGVKRSNSAKSVGLAQTEEDREWLWYSSSGAIDAWRPGQTARVVGQVDTFEHLFEFKGATYLSDRAEGRLSRLTMTGAMEPVFANGTLSAITCAETFDQDFALVGTYGLGLQLFDGKSVRPFPADSLLSTGARINDLCATEGGFFAAAVANYGIILFTRAGHVVQVLDRSLDHRLSGVTRLLSAPGGVLWGLFDGGVVRLGFPSQISRFEPLMGTGITTVHPYRYKGRLWSYADGKIYQGKYDADGRLVQMESSTPAQRFVGTFSVTTGIPIAGTTKGAFFYRDSDWVPFAPELNHLRVLAPGAVEGRWLYSAQNEIGWLQVSPDKVEIIERIPAPGLSRVFNSEADRKGRVWLELGTGRVGVIHQDEGKPSYEVFTADNGVPGSWAQLFEIDGAIYFNFAEHVFRFDDATRRFVSDEALVQSLPGVKKIIGRPGVDARGKLWITADGAVNVLEKISGRWQKVVLSFELGFEPYYFTFESDGVVWMHALHRLARYDPATPVFPPPDLRALITQVNVTASDRTLFANEGVLPTLGFSENSLIVHFVASGNSLGTPVTFEVKLDGATSSWVSTGSAGSAAFNRLKEGKYLLHVRPRSGAVIGEEHTLTFSIRPPWYRTTIAYVAYGLSAIGTVLAAAWLLTFLGRRENRRLEKLVAERTGELSKSNAQLVSQLEEIRILTRAIMQSPIAVFITAPDGTIEFTNPRTWALTGCSDKQLIGSKLQHLRAPVVSPLVFEEIETALRAGDSWSGQLVNRRMDGSLVHVRSSISPILNPDGQARHHLVLEEDITEWRADQQRHRRLEAQLAQAQKMKSIGTLAGGIAHDFNNLLTGILGYCELAQLSLDDHGDVRPDLIQIKAAGMRAKSLVAQILTFSRQSQTKFRSLDLAQPVDEALKLIRATTPATIAIVQKLESGAVLADATQIHQVVMNLCTNAVHALRGKAGRLEVRLSAIEVDAQLAEETSNLKPGSYQRLIVADNGRGMDSSTLERIFDPFFTTKAQGEGTGLGLAIVQGVVDGHGGAIQVRSQPDAGTTFEIYFPRTDEALSVPGRTAELTRGTGQEIVVVDDEPTVVDFVAARLKQFGYSPTVFTDPVAALTAFKSEPNRFAAVVTDLTMPQLTGINLINQMRMLRPLLPAVVMTGYGRDSVREEIGALLHCVLLQKPFSGEDVAQALAQVINTAREA